MNRGDFQRLADERLSEANLLLAARKWAGAYYLAGYAVECALKACILARIEREGLIFTEKKFAEQCWTHDLTALIYLAGLEDAWKDELKNNFAFRLNWEATCEWSERARYEFIAQQVAIELVSAIEDPTEGVLQWIKTYW